MTWKVSNLMEQRVEFISKMCDRQTSFSKLCEDFGISRQTGYKWAKRYREEGPKGLDDRRKAPHKQPLKLDSALENRILEVKDRYPNWGAKKIHAYLRRKFPIEGWPTSTTFHNVLKRHGHVHKRKKRLRLPCRTEPLSHCLGPNDVWCIDFKGWFITRDKIKCEPLTITDAFSRRILHCSQRPSPNAEDVWGILEGLFQKYGLPKYLRHDNGPPFGSTGVGRLSSLSVNLVKAGVIPEWIDPASPHQNGRHERMHGTLKGEATFPLQLSLTEQEMKFREFVTYYNNERPHEGIGFKVPRDLYRKSKRKWDGQLRSPQYDPTHLVKRVGKSGQITWVNRSIFIGKTLRGENIGLCEGDDGEWLAYFGPVQLGIIDQSGSFHISRLPSRPKRKYKARCF